MTANPEESTEKRRIAELEGEVRQLQYALTVVAGSGCANFTVGSCRTNDYPSDAWCPACIADDILDVI